MAEVKNAIITHATLTNADHGLLSAWLTLDYGSTGQGFGGFCLYSERFRDGPNYAGHFIWRCLEIAGVDDWSRLTGRTIRAKADHGKVYAIGHIVKDDWFDPAAELQAMKGKEVETA